MDSREAQRIFQKADFHYRCGKYTEALQLLHILAETFPGNAHIARATAACNRAIAVLGTEPGPMAPVPGTTSRFPREPEGQYPRDRSSKSPAAREEARFTQRLRLPFLAGSIAFVLLAGVSAIVLSSLHARKENRSERGAIPVSSKSDAATGNSVDAKNTASGNGSSEGAGSFGVPPGVAVPVDKEPAYCRATDQAIIIGNGYLEFTFSRDNGELAHFVHKRSGTDLKSPSANAYKTSWGIGILTPEGKRSVTDNARSTEFFQRTTPRITRDADGVVLELTWLSLRLDEALGQRVYPATVNVTISVSDDSPLSEWKINVHNAGLYAIEKVSCPLICGIRELGSDGNDDCLIVPTLEGRLYHNPAQNLQWAGNTYPSCFLNMQFAAYYDNTAGFYFACYDNQGYVKRFSYNTQWGPWASMWFDHYGDGIKYGEDFIPPYPMIVGVFEGDWYTAADIYRQWATNQWWARRTLNERNLPAWLTDCGVGSCFVTQADFKEENTSFEEISQLARNHQRYSETGLLTELWGWENKGAWSFGDYFPPLEGWASFDNLVADFHANRCRLCTYIGSSALNGHTDFWKSQRPLTSAKRTESGRLLEGEAPLATVEMCEAAAFWQEHLQQTAVELAKHKVDLIQFDCFPVPPLNAACYATNHGHPPGVGKWTTDAWLNILSKTVTACRDVNLDVCFTSEGIAEIYIPYLDVAHYWRDVFSEVGLNERELLAGTAEIIPLFHYVYHNYIVSQGQYYLGLAQPHPEYNILCMGRMFVWGEIPLQNTWIRTEQFDDRPALKLWKRIGKARTSYAKDFLVYGRMQRPLEFTCPSTTVPMGEALGDTSSDAVMQVPSIMHSAWRASDGDTGFVFVNIAEEPVSMKTPIDFNRFGIRDGHKPLLYCVRDGKYSILKINSDSVETIDITIQPCEIVFIGLCEAGSSRAQQVRQLVANREVLQN